MNNVHDFGLMAELAEASYANFDPQGPFKNDPRTALIRMGTDDPDNTDDPEKGFSPSQADAFLDRWQIVHHQPDTDSGFSATLFKSTDSNAVQPYVLAIRGTAGFFQDLVITDGSDIVMDGLAIDQIVDLWNYWQQLTNGQPFAGARLETLAEETAYLAMAKAGKMIPGLNIPAAIYLQQLYARTDIIIDNGAGWEVVRTIVFDQALSGVLDTPLSVEQVSGVTGHSLGGHLSAALTRLVPGIEALTINGAGFTTGLIPGVGGDARLNVHNLFDMLGSAGSFDSTRILNLYGDKMPEFVTQNLVFGLQQQGGHESIFIEQSPPWGNTLGHGSEQMTDSLSIYRLLSIVDKSIGSALIEQLLETSTNERASSLEKLLNAVGDIFKVGHTVQIDNRESFYSRLSAIYKEFLNNPNALQPELKSAYQNLKIISANTLAGSALQNTPEGLAYRYALKELNAFAVLGANYDKHNASNELDLYNPETHQGAITGNWITGRAAMLVRLLAENSAAIDLPFSGDNTYYVNLGSNLEPDTILKDNLVPGIDKTIIFGSGKGETLTGKSGIDHLYGGEGNDTLNGGEGDDYLEGGSGKDTYVFSGDFGKDRILDTDGKGKILINGTVLGAAKGTGEANTWNIKGTNAEWWKALRFSTDVRATLAGELRPTLQSGTLVAYRSARHHLVAIRQSARDTCHARVHPHLGIADRHFRADL